MATRKRVLRLGLIAGLGLLAALLLWAAMSPRHLVNWRTLRQIHSGMTRQEVEQVFGRVLTGGIAGASQSHFVAISS